MMKLFFLIVGLTLGVACGGVMAEEDVVPFKLTAFDADLARLATLTGDSNAFQDEAREVLMKVWRSIAAPDNHAPLADLLAFNQKIAAQSETVPLCPGWTLMRIISFNVFCQALGQTTPAKTPEFGPTLKSARDLLDGLEAEFVALGGKKVASPLGNYDSPDLPQAMREANRKAVAAQCLLSHLPDLREILLQQCLKMNPGGSRQQLAAKLKEIQFTPAQIRAVMEDVPVRRGR